MLKRKWTLIPLLLAVGVCFAQQVPAPYYDTFGQKFINPNKWLATTPQAWGSPLEVVREIRNGQLRLGVRNIGRSDSDSGAEWAESELYFVNPNHIKSIISDMTVMKADAIQCPGNEASDFGYTTIGGQFFNTGSGDPAQDVTATVVSVSTFWDGPRLWTALWWSTGDGTAGDLQYIGEYPLGQRRTASIKWDQASHQFIGSITVSGVKTEVFSTYSVPDSTPPAAPQKALSVAVLGWNCMETRTFTHVEALFDNVTVNR